ncbi:hypothetical protein HW555_002771 [Spodoptera exigua]|uniref:Daxx histone-binding domain-containing protein n=1 Tax=Spodoptera exigua TaxID=7107 RepID=A0A835L7Q3_SPOEX|nr:hypothetical protein HW555_002771 [Spodoptera exigua]
MDSEPVVIEDDDGDAGAVVIVDDDVIITEQKPDSTIVIDDEPHMQINEAGTNNAGDKTKKVSEKESTDESSFRINLRNNNLMDNIINTCLNMQNGAGMSRVIHKTLIPLYRDSNPELKKSKALTNLLKRVHKMLLRDPNHKFLHIKTLCEELKSGRVRKKVPFVTLSTDLRDNKTQFNLSDSQTDMKSKTCDEPNKSNNVTVVEVEDQEEVQENIKAKKRKPNNKIRKTKPKRQRIMAQSKKSCNTDSKNVDVIELVDSDNECGNLSSSEATTSTQSDNSVTISPNSSTGEESNKENNESKKEIENNDNKPNAKNIESKKEIENNDNKPDNKPNAKNIESTIGPEINDVQNKMKTIVFIPFYSIPIIDTPPIPSFTMQNQNMPINNCVPMIDKPVPKKYEISKTIAVIEYNASQNNNNNNLSSDDVDVEVLIPQTHIENQGKESDDTNKASNIIETNKNNKPARKQNIESTKKEKFQDIFSKSLKEIGITLDSNPIEKSLVQDYAVSKTQIEKRTVEDYSVPKNQNQNAIVQGHMVPKILIENGKVQGNMFYKNQMENEIDQDLLVPKNHKEISIQDVEPYDCNQSELIAYHERCIVSCKEALAKLEEQEVTTDDPKFSPYIQCAKLKESIVESYRTICAIKGNAAVVVKKCEIKLNVAQGHHPGPAKALQKFLNSTLGKDGSITFPDFEDVLQCVFTSNTEDQLGWSSSQVFKEARALFVQCGQALRKRRQKREYQDLMSLMRDKNLEDDDPAEKDPLLFAKYAAMESQRYHSHGGNSTVEFLCNEESSGSSTDEDVTSPHRTETSKQDTPSTSSSTEDKIDMNCRKPSLDTILIEETDNDSALMNPSQCSSVNSNITQPITEDNIESSKSTNVDSLASNEPDETVMSKDNNNCEKDNLSQENVCVNNIKEEKETIKINFSEPIDSISFMPNCSHSSTNTSNTENIETNFKTQTTTIKPERLDVQAMLNERGGNFECTVFDIEDPFLVIEISSDDYSDDDL